jgi:formiminotetrahydrofolate cyclodeaminase
VNDEDIAARPVGAWLEALASAAPAPGGGAAAALNVAVGAALIEMVCNLTIGKPRYAEHEATMKGALARAGEVRAKALALADEDADAFAAVSTAYKLPKDTSAEKADRTAAIQAALVGAADVPLRTAEAAGDVVRLAAEILEGSNVNVISDVAVAASSARAGLESAAVNVEINLAAMADAAQRDQVAGRLALVKEHVDEAERVVLDVAHKVNS